MNGSALEFGVDDYIKARAGLAECLMNSNRTEHAIQKFEGVKRKIESEVVFDKPILFINIYKIASWSFNAFLHENRTFSDLRIQLTIA